MKSKLIKLFLILCLILGFFLRTYDLNWDQGFHLHPDERAIVLYALPLKVVSNFKEFFSINSSLNPHFFAYGSFPIYLLKFVAQALSIFNSNITQYGNINLLGRFISALFDSTTIFIIYLITKKISSRKTALIASFIYSISVLPIQLSHFYAVDTLLTFFITLTIYQLILFYENPNVYNALVTGIIIGFSLATKTSAIALVSAVGATSIIDFILLFFKNPHKFHIWFPHVSKYLKKLIIELFIILSTSFITFILIEPYALIDFNEFWTQNLQQSQMTHNAFIFPYTLQYVGIVPYFYEIKNIFLWGEGSVISILSFIGIFFIVKHLLKEDYQRKSQKILIMLIFAISYFAVVGKFAVGFMRYMLPLYPILSILASFTISFFEEKITSKKLKIILSLILATLIVSWTFTFMKIYTQPNTRVSATNWINKNIPVGSTITIEHWDDSLPLIGQENYNMITLPLYDPDTLEKWVAINQNLKKTDYIILASNRLYVPLQKLTNCKNLPEFKCYPITANYYKNLFVGKNVLQLLNQIHVTNAIAKFKLVAVFQNNPTIPLLNFKINDQVADESFTVYDHPTVMIFKKE